jgi:hypothetical protein
MLRTYSDRQTFLPQRTQREEHRGNAMSILRQIFGPSKEEIWQRLAEEIGADYTDGGIFNPGKVQVHVKGWTITLDTYTVHTGHATIIYTRMRAPYVNKDGFGFKIYRKGFLSDIGKKLGMKDIVVGHPEFDEEFIIQGNDQEKVRALCDNGRFRELLEKQPKILLQVKDDEGWFGAKFPEGVDELYFQVQGVIKDIELLKDLYELFAVTLDQLCRIDSAYDSDPGLTL